MSRISPGLLLIAFFAILIGLAGAYFVKRQLAQEKPAPPAPLTFPVATMDLPIGRIVANGDVMQMPFTTAQRLQLPPVLMSNPKQVIGRTLAQPIAKGKTFSPDVFYAEGREPTAADRVKPGFRAVGVLLRSVDAVASQIVPGCFVDVLFRATPKKGEDLPEETIVLVQRVELLAIGDNSTPGQRGGWSEKDTTIVTLAVTPQQAQELRVVEGHGELSLSLRSNAEAAMGVPPAPLTLAELLHIPPKPPPPKEPEPFVAEIYRAGKRQTLVFAGTQVAKEDFGGIDINPPRPAPDPAATPAPAPAPAPDQRPQPILQDGLLQDGMLPPDADILQ